MKIDIDFLTFLVPVISAKAEIFESLLFQPNYSTRMAMVKKSKNGVLLWSYFMGMLSMTLILPFYPFVHVLN